MKEQIYTIPINEAFEKDCECPLCDIAARLDTEAIEYTLGAAMMEPDFRIITNEKGFCKYHLSKLYEQGKFLPLSLIMKSQSEHQNKKLLNVSAPAQKKLFQKSSRKQSAKACAETINKFISSCAICDKIEHTMDKFLQNTIFLWKTQPDFKQKFNEKRFCLPHYAKLVEYAIDGLGESEFEVFYKELTDSQTKVLDEIYNDITEFTNLFDHRNKGNSSPEIKSSPKRWLHIYSGSIQIHL